MSGYYKTSPKRPYHVSIGCLLLDADNKVVCHKHQHDKLGTIYTLVRESIEENESPEDVISRGLMEEMGATAEIVSYIGSLTANDTWFGEIGQPTPVQKTTVYFLAKLITLDESKRLTDDPESKSEIVHLELDGLAKLMQEQGERTGYQDIDESSIVNNAKKYLSLQQS
jgi:hypothetical protein